MAWYDEVLGRLHNARPVAGRANDWMATCPLHKGGREHNPSLHVRVEGAAVLMICFACGPDATPEIVRLLGLRMGDLFEPDPDRKRNPMALKPSKAFVYEDEEGRPLYRALRYDFDGGGKTFSQERWADGKWVAGVGPEPGVPGAAFTTRRVPYKLPLLLARPDQPVVVVEGEGKVELLLGWGLLATCGVGGCGMGWLDVYSKALADRRVAVLPDNDPPGYRHAERVLGGLIRFGAREVRLVEIPGLGDGCDVVDFARAGGTRDQLVELIRNTPAWRSVP